MEKILITLTVMLPTLIEIIDTSVVNVSMDHIRGSLSASIDETTWAITSYLVANAIIIPMTGWLSRIFGRKRYLIFSVSLFTVSSFFCGFAWSLQSLVFFRILQGLGGGAMQPISQSILLETFPPKQHGMAMAIYGIGIMFGPIIGPLLGGWITDNWSWHWIFYINIPIGILSVIMAFFFLKDPSYMKKHENLKIDYFGLSLLVIGLGSLQLMLDQGQREDWFASNYITMLAAVSFVALSLFIVVEYFFAKHPIVNLRVFKSVSFATGNVVMFFAFFNMFGSIVLLPIFLQGMMGYTATLAGVVLGPGGLATLIGMPITGKMVTLINPKKILAAGLSVAALSTYMMGNFNLQVDFNTVIWPRVVLGIGMSMLFIPLMTCTLSGIRKEEMGNATSIFSLLRNLGGSFGVAFVTTLLTHRSQIHHAELVSRMTPFDPAYDMTLNRMTGALASKGLDAVSAKQAALGAMNGQLIKQSTMLAFNDVFHTMTVMLLLVVPLVIMLKAPKYDKASQTAAGH